MGFNGGVPEWSNGADCKSVGDAFGGSNPPPPTFSQNAEVAHLAERQPSKL